MLNEYSPDGGGFGGPQGILRFTQGITSTTGAALTQYNSYAAYLLGLPQSMGRAAQQEIMTAYNNQFAFYARDRFQVNQKLTLSAGVPNAVPDRVRTSVKTRVLPCQVTRSNSPHLKSMFRATNLWPRFFSSRSTA